MANLRPIRIPNFEGGLFTGEQTIAKDNQLTTATNVFYNDDRKLQTRRGYANFGNTIPDTVTVIHDMDTTAGNGTWAVASDGVTLTAETTNHKRGAGSLKFNIDVSNSGDDFATLTNSTFSQVDISSSKGNLGFWFKAPSGFKTDFTDIRVRIGSDSSNYYEFTVNAVDFTEEQYSFIRKAWSGASTTGTPVDTAIDYGQIIINYTASYTDKTGVEFDDIVAYSSTSTKPPMSAFFLESSSGTRHLICNAGTNMFEYHEATESWNVIETGLTEGTRFGFLVYKDIIYFGNGVDDYRDYNLQKVTSYPGTPKYKYFLLANDIGYALGDPDNKSTLGYTAGTPGNMQTFPNLLVLDEDDSAGVGTGLVNLESIVIAAKERKIYKVNTAASSRTQLDYSEGIDANRSIVRVENEVFFLNKAGVYTLGQREGLLGSARADALTEDIRQIINSADNLEIANGIYVSRLNNYYLWLDTNNDEILDTCLVFSRLTRKWTKYVGINCNQAVVYRDSSGNEKLLIADSFTGRMREIETGFGDNDAAIDVTVETKNFDFDAPETHKTFEYVDFFGFISENAVIDYTIIVDDEETVAGQIIGSVYAAQQTSPTFTLDSTPLDQEAIDGAGGEGDLDLYPFKARVSFNITGTRIKMRLSSQKEDTAWILTKSAVYPYPQPLDIYPTDSYV